VVILLKTMFIEFASNACNYYERGRSKSPLYISTVFKMQASSFICVGYHKLVATCSRIKCQYIGRELN
jgi:hypothetical protein